MKIELMNIEDIHFQITEYDTNLKNSLLRIGISFPIRVRFEHNAYHCVDGHKRLTAIQDILKDDPTPLKFQKIRVIVMNYARSAAPRSLHNAH